MIQNTPIDNMEKKRKQLRGIVTDVDGILTNGQIAYREDGLQTHFFSALDGFGFFNLIDAGFVIAVISGRKNLSAKYRAEELGVKEIFLAINDKFPVLQSLSEKYNIPLEHWAMVGDDVNDIQCMRHVDFSFTVPNAHHSAKNTAAFTTNRSGGDGAFREVSDWILAP
jgi:3-deoxy-D-manno-octulosonate 8-phosphate phosphatase (KDO 8-P phosphatase)|tara:strand:- start:5516 stop:6019 length:504 start_codon:yes stop_codon:yes gene_type:complete